MQREHIVKLMAARAEKPDSANGLRKVLRAMMQHAIEINFDPTTRHRALKTFGLNQNSVSTDGQNRKSLNSRNATRLDLSPALHWLLASIRDRHGRMWLLWGRNIYVMKF